MGGWSRPTSCRRRGKMESSSAANDAVKAMDVPVFEVVAGVFRLTPEGIARYKERFAKAGFRIDAIKSAEAFETALEGSLHIELDEIAARISRTRYSDALEGALLKAVVNQDEAERQRIAGLLQRRRSLGLQCITGGAGEAQPG